MNTNHEMGVVGDSDGYDMATFEENGNEEREKESQTEEEGENLDNGSASVLQDEFIYSIVDSPSWHLSLLFGFQVRSRGITFFVVVAGTKWEILRTFIGIRKTDEHVRTKGC